MVSAYKISVLNPVEKRIIQYDNSYGIHHRRGAFS